MTDFTGWAVIQDDPEHKGFLSADPFPVAWFMIESDARHWVDHIIEMVPRLATVYTIRPFRITEKPPTPPAPSR